MPLYFWIFVGILVLAPPVGIFLDWFCYERIERREAKAQAPRTTSTARKEME